MKKTFMGVKLRKLRAEHGLSQIALAHALGLSPSYLNQLEQNQRPLTVSVLLKINAAFGVDVQMFSEDEEARLIAGLREALADVEEGADALIVKPGLPCLDVLRMVRDAVTVPVAAYQVSGEYAALHAAAERGWLDLDAAMWEAAISLRRAGADQLITYFARPLAEGLRAGHRYGGRDR